MCEHKNFACNVDVGRIEDKPGGKIIRFTADVRIACADCNIPMRFIGLPYGIDLNGAAVSVDGTEGRFAIAPKGEVVTMLDEGVTGFTARRIL